MNPRCAARQHPARWSKEAAFVSNRAFPFLWLAVTPQGARHRAITASPGISLCSPKGCRGRGCSRGCVGPAASWEQVKQLEASAPSRPPAEKCESPPRRTPRGTRR